MLALKPSAMIKCKRADSSRWRRAMPMSMLTIADTPDDFAGGARRRAEAMQMARYAGSHR